MARPTCDVVSRTRRTIILIGLEACPGIARDLVVGAYTVGIDANPGSIVQFPIAEEYNPYQANFDSIRLTLAKPTLDPSGFIPGIGTAQLRGQVYISGSAIPNVPPPWTKLLQISGYRETRYTTAIAGPADVSNVMPTPDAGGDLGFTDGTGDHGGDYNYKVSIVETTGAPGEGHLSAAIPVSVNFGDKVSFTGLNNLDGAGAGANKVKRIYRTAESGADYFYIGTVASGVDTFIDVLNDDQLAEPAPDEIAETNKVIWTPLSDNIPSATFFNFLDSRKYVATGARGTFEATGDAGALFPGRFEVEGEYTPGALAPNPTFVIPPDFPPRLVAIQAQITPSGGAQRIPVVKRVGFNTGTPRDRRLDANAAQALIEVGAFNEYDPHLTLEIEVNKNWSWLDEFVAITRYNVSFQIGTTGSGILKFTMPTAQLAAAPPFGDSNGIRTQSLDMAGVGTNNDFASVEHTA